MPQKASLAFNVFVFRRPVVPRVLKSLAKHMPFELAAGLNGAFWVDSGEKGRPSSTYPFVAPAATAAVVVALVALPCM